LSGWWALCAVLALLALLLAGLFVWRQPARAWLFNLSGERDLFPQLKALSDLSADLMRPQVQTADLTPVQYAGVNPFGVNVFLEQEVEPAKRELAVKMAAEAGFHWLRQEFPGRWSDATQVQFASKLLSAASEAGLVSPKRDPRTLPLPKVTDAALGYVLHLLRGTRIAGTLTDNPYLASLGLSDGFLDGRLRHLPGVKLRRMGGLTEFDWNAADLPSWAQAQGLVLR
jgi:hypothetical protein